MNFKSIKKNLKLKLKNDYQVLKNFGPTYALDDFLVQFIFRKRNKIGKKLIQKKHEKVKEYLLTNYNEMIESYKNQKENKDHIEKDAPIWILWWQGLDVAPEIVQACFESIKRNAGNHPINLLTKNNYKNYIEFPDYIIEKLNNNVITLTHFSDLLRVSLLYKYGGIWLDSTIFLNQYLHNDIYDYSFYTVKHNLYKDFHVCKGIWTDSVFMSSRQNVFMKYIMDFFMEYWKRENCLITYLLIDCIIAIGYENIEFIKKELDKIPVNNTDIFEIENNISKPYNTELFDIKKSSTYIFKTSYKRNLVKEIDGKETFYAKILKGKITD